MYAAWELGLGERRMVLNNMLVVDGLGGYIMHINISWELTVRWQTRGMS